MNIAPGFLRSAYRDRRLTPSDVMAHALSRLSDADQSGVWISTVDPAVAMAAARALDRRIADIDTLPLYGLPFCVKDCIDVEGEPTTSACPEFRYMATASSRRPRSPAGGSR